MTSKEVDWIPPLYVITNDGKEVKMEDWDWGTNSPSPLPNRLFDEEMMKLFQGDAK